MNSCYGGCSSRKAVYYWYLFYFIYIFSRKNELTFHVIFLFLVFWFFSLINLIHDVSIPPNKSILLIFSQLYVLILLICQFFKYIISLRRGNASSTLKTAIFFQIIAALMSFIYFLISILKPFFLVIFDLSYFKYNLFIWDDRATFWRHRFLRFIYNYYKLLIWLLVSSFPKAVNS